MTMSERLERVRRVNGIKSVRKFWHSLGGREMAGSYESARLYHTGRDAPVAYLARVVEVYGVDPMWLMAGKGDGPQCSHAFVCVHCGAQP